MLITSVSPNINSIQARRVQAIKGVQTQALGFKSNDTIDVRNHQTKVEATKEQT